MAEPIFINGSFLVLQGITGSAGDKNSVASIVVPVNFPDLQTALATNPADVAAALGISGLNCVDRPFSEDPDGEITVRFQFEGFNSEVSFEQAEPRIVVSWDPVMSEDPIQTHPKFLGESGIASKWGWNFDEEKFGKNRPGKADGTTALSKEDIKTPPTNPFFGVQNWRVVGGTFKRSYAVTTVPANVYQKIGTLIDYPPSASLINIPRFKRRKWLKLAPTVSQSGSAYRVEESYELTGVTNGAEAIIYAAGQLEE